jgi:hypothetical protein
MAGETDSQAQPKVLDLGSTTGADRPYGRRARVGEVAEGRDHERPLQ